MSHYFTTELGRMRTEEAIARADRYRLAQQSRRSKSGTESKRLSWSRSFAYRRALTAFGLSALMIVGFAAVALASPMGPGASGDGASVWRGRGRFALGLLVTAIVISFAMTALMLVFALAPILGPDGT